MKKMLVSVALLVLLVGASAAQEKKPDSEGWEPANGEMMQKGETIPASGLVAGAYGFLFASVALFAAWVTARGRKLEEDMGDLKRSLDAKRK